MTKEEIHAIAQEVVRVLVERVAGAPSPAPKPQNATPSEPRYMSAAQYGKRVGYGRTTVQRWIRAGIPCVPSARGHRIDVKAADAWLEAGGARRALDS